MKKDVALRLENVDLRFGSVEALRGVSLEIPHHARIALVGPSGSGKTSLLRLLGASILPTRGAVFHGEQDSSLLSVAELRRLRSRIAFIHQSLDLIPNLRVYQNVLMGRIAEFGALRTLKSSLRPSAQLQEEVFTILTRLGIAEKMFVRTDRLSGGQMQRVAIARALFQRPVLILADEPVSSVDPTRAQASIELLCELAKENDSALVLSLHNFNLAMQYFPRLVGLSHGKVLFDAAPADITEEQQTSLYTLETNELLI